MFTPKISRSLFQRGVKVARRKFPFEKGDERGFEFRTLNELLRNPFIFSMTIQARRNCPGVTVIPAWATDLPLLRAGQLIYIRPWFNAFKTFKAFKSIPDSYQRLERFERSAAIERLEPGIRYIARKPC
jgi:hypothetical protein